MQLGMIGLGRMGSNMVQRLLKDGHECVVHDTHPQAMQELVSKGAKSATALAEFIKKLTKPRAVWLMVPAAVVDSVLESLKPLLERGDIVIDGGNSYYHDDIRRAGLLKPSGINYVDCGTSGGVWGLERGYCLMIGGDEGVVVISIPSSNRWHPAWQPRRARPEPPESPAPRKTATCDAAPTARGIS
jgi:6-phosphogluconate dehydrogenase